MRKNSKNTGFTLVEMSIVLAIIGLLVSAVIVGNAVVSMSKLRSAIIAQNNLQSAIKQFKLTYNALPGDFTNAYLYWGGQSNCPNNATSITTSISATNNTSPYCNGNGNGIIDGAMTGCADATSEGTQALVHLSLAKIIAGQQYTGGSCTFALMAVTTASPSTTSAATVYPMPSIAGAGYNIQYSLSGSSLLNNSIAAGNYLVLSGANSGASGTAGQPGGNILNPGDTYYIDSKIDDGLPSSGFTMAYAGYATTAGGVNCITSSAYSVTETKPTCVLVHLIR